MSSSNVRFEWFQTSTNISITFYVKDRTKDDVIATLSEDGTELDVTIKLPEGKEYQYNATPLFARCKQPNGLTVTVKSMKIELSMQKEREGFSWPAVQAPATADPAAVQTSMAASSAPKEGEEKPKGHGLAFPNSKGKDWSKVSIDEDVDEGMDPGKKFFQQIAAHCSDDQRRAIMKSYTESGGTVLSTNWQDVADRKVESAPPKGMEERKWKDDTK